jgi:hypothetical protein
VRHLRLLPAGRADLLRRVEWVEGIVTVWGRIEAHRGGLRAEHARVCALARRPGVDAIARELGVDVVERDELEEAAARYGVPLPPALVPQA